MVKTEATRAIITACEQLHPPQDVVDALQKHNSSLELIWNPDATRWEVYQVKTRGAIRSEDVLCWQMSAPTKGSGITVGIVQWLRKFDTTNGGMKSKEELEKDWLQFCRKLFREIEPDRVQKRINNAIECSREFIHDLSTEKTGISVPTKVAYDTKTGKSIYAIKKQRRVLHGF